LILSLPLVALLVRLMGTGGWSAYLFLFSAIVFTGCGAHALAVEHLKHRRVRRAEESTTRRSRFNALLLNELRTRPTKRFDFTALVQDAGLPGVEADQVADEVYRKMADRIVMDGVITIKERSKLDRLARVLEMDASRAARIEQEAKSGVYRKAVAEALSDGTVTEEEACMLNALRVNLGLDEPSWIAGDIVS
jgi:hypothetical protein